MGKLKEAAPANVPALRKKFLRFNKDLSGLRFGVGIGLGRCFFTIIIGQSSVATRFSRVLCFWKGKF